MTPLPQPPGFPDLPDLPDDDEAVGDEEREPGNPGS